jgi:DNA-binding NarL/FixJ family response regulator
VALRATRVVVADDHPQHRALVREVLEAAGFEVCSEAADAATAAKAVLEHRADLALLDVRMPGGGARAAREIKASSPSTFVVMLTVSDESADLFDALRAGASGYVLKGGDPRRIPEILERVVSGEAVAPASLVQQMVGTMPRRLRASLAGQQPPLTSREWEVLELLAEDYTTAEISERLFVAEVTVRSHIGAILHKLGVKDRAEAVSFLLRGNHPCDS